MLQYVNLGYSPLLVASRDACLDQSSSSKNYVVDEVFSTQQQNSRCKISRPSSRFQTKLSSVLPYKSQYISLSVITPKGISIPSYSLYWEKRTKGKSQTYLQREEEYRIVGGGGVGARQVAVVHAKSNVCCYKLYALVKIPAF